MNVGGFFDDGKYTYIAAHYSERAMGCSRGCYQEAILNGSEAWSGATLKGKAGMYSSKYAKSRDNLLQRMIDLGLPVHKLRVDNNRRVVYIGDLK